MIAKASFLEVLTREQMTDLDNDDLLNRHSNSDRTMIDQRFCEMNRQIGKLTNLVLALIQQMSSNPREGNSLNMIASNSNSRSDSIVSCASVSSTVKATVFQERIARFVNFLVTIA